MNVKVEQFCLWLAEREIWWIGALIAAGMLSNTMLVVTSIAGVLFLGIRKAARGRFSTRTPLDLALLPMMLMLPVTILVTPLLGHTLPQVLRLLSGIVLYYAMVNWTRNLQHLRLLSNGMILIGVALALIAPFGVKWFTNKLPFIPNFLYERFPLLLSDPIHPNVMAGSLIVIESLLFALLVFQWRFIRPAQRASYLAAFALIGFVLLLTQSRGAWLAFGISTLLTLLLGWRRGWLAIPVVVLLATLLTVWLGMNHTLDMLFLSETLGGIQERMEVWSRALYMIQDFPLTGTGMGTFMEITNKVYPFFYIGPQRIDHAHNLYLQIAVDLGVPGLVSWMAAFLLVILSALKIYRRGIHAQNRYMAGLGAGLFCCQVAMAVHGCIDAVVWGMVRSAPLIWALWGLTSAGLLVYEDHLSHRNEQAYHNSY